MEQIKKRLEELNLNPLECEFNDGFCYIFTSKHQGDIRICKETNEVYTDVKGFVGVLLP